MKRFLLITFTFFYGITYAQFQEIEQKEAIKKLHWLLGEWHGSSVVNMEGKKSIVFVTKTVKPNLYSTIFIFNGRGTEKDTITKNNIIVHDAFAVIS